MPRISSPRPLDLTKPFVTSSQSYGSQPFDLSQNLVTWYRDIQGDFVPDLSGRGNTARCAGSGSHDRVTGSNDIPEYNPLNYPLQSFNLSDNATLTSNVQHISTINSSGRTIALDDHSFTDGSRDIPFSLSFWLKLDSTSATQYIATKTALSSGNYEWFVVIDVNNRLTFRLYSGGEPSPYIEAYETSAFTALHNGWDHFVLTYNGSGTTSGIEIYRNGSDVAPAKGGVSIASYTSMIKTSSPLCLGTILSKSLVPQITDIRGKIHSFAVWKNREINSTEARALYNAYLKGPGGEIRSGFTSKSPRLQLRELDDLPGSYPTVRRTGDPTRTGALSSNFNDGTSIVFSQSGNVVFPTMLPKGSSFASQAVDIIGQESDISASLPIRSFQQPNHLHYSPVEEMGPFDENRVMPATSFFLSGTDPDVLPGFSSPMRSKSQIEIDITPSNEFTLTRNYKNRNTYPGTVDRSGFAYFNFTSKLWQDVGLIDPLNGSSLPHDIAINDMTSASPVISGTENIVSQFSKRNSVYNGAFCSATGSTTFKDVFFVDSEGEELFLSFARSSCTPTISFGAPNSSKYFATSSQVLKLDGISDPFLLEAISVQMDVETQCFFTASAIPYADTATYFLSPNDYVFFLYAQRKTKRGLSLSSDEISGSTRSIIASASVTFYHTAGVPPFHTPALAVPVTSSKPFFPTTAPVITQFTGTLNFTFYPGTCGEAWTIFDMPAYTGSTPSLTNRQFQGYWPGGPSATLKENSWSVGKSATSAVPILSQFGLSGSLARSNVDIVLDSHHHRTVGGESQGFNFADLSDLGYSSGSLSQNNSRVVSPYLLMPGDEIVLGIEQVPLFHHFITDVEQDFELFSSSSMTITPTKSKITLHGSRVQNQREILSSLNQDLSSNSIHEIIGAELVLDQFMIEPRSSYYGSYLDEIVTGSMAILNPDGITFTIYDQDNSRRVISRTST